LQAAITLAHEEALDLAVLDVNLDAFQRDQLERLLRSVAGRSHFRA
jgi:hypothetical protein